MEGLSLAARGSYFFLGLQRSTRMNVVVGFYLALPFESGCLSQGLRRLCWRQDVFMVVFGNICTCRSRNMMALCAAGLPRTFLTFYILLVFSYDPNTPAT